MNIDYPSKATEPRLWRLWKEAFGDTEAFLECYRMTAFSPERCRCATEGERLLGAYHWLEHRCDGRRFAYVYAVAVDAAVRGRGIGKALMADAKAVLAGAGYAGAVLVPAEEALRQYYRNLGYRDFGGLRRVSCLAGQSTAALEPLSLNAYLDLRQHLLPSGSVEPAETARDFLGTQLSFYRGEDFLLAAVREGDRLFGAELLGEDSRCAGILRALNCREGRFCLPGKDAFAMYLPLAEDCPEPKYFAFAFD